MSKLGFKQERNTNGGKYYWKLQDWVNKLFMIYNKCLICGSKENLEPHHVIQVKPYDKLYSDTNNGVILCKSCHKKYHEQYGGNINAGTLLKFGLRNVKGKNGLSIAQLNKELKQSYVILKYYQDEAFRLREELDELKNKRGIKNG